MPVCDYCGKVFSGIGVNSTQSSCCSHECSADWAARAGGMRKKVVSRVINELEQGDGEKTKTESVPRIGTGADTGGHS
jgi:hypothetical protein